MADSSQNQIEGWLMYHALAYKKRQISIKKATRAWVEITSPAFADSRGALLRWSLPPGWNYAHVVETSQVEAICVGARMTRDAIPVRNGKFRLCFTVSTSSKAYVFRAGNEEALQHWMTRIHNVVFDTGKLPPRLCVKRFFDPDASVQFVGMLLRDGVPPDVRNERGDTALIAATREKKLNVMKLLLGAGADVNKLSTGTHETALSVAVRNSASIECVSILLQARRLRLDRIDFKGMSAIHYAAKCANAAALEMMVRAGANVEIIVQPPKTPPSNSSAANVNRGIARWRAHSTNYAPGVDTADVGRNALHLICAIEASSSARPDDVRACALLLCKKSRGKLASFRDKRGYLPIHLAARSGNAAALRGLLDFGSVRVTAVDRDGRTALRIATSASRYECVKLLREQVCDNASSSSSSSRTHSSMCVEVSSNSTPMRVRFRDGHTELSESSQSSSTISEDEEGGSDVNNVAPHAKPSATPENSTVAATTTTTTTTATATATTSTTTATAISGHGDGTDGWYVCYTEEGHEYYYNEQTGQSQWESPWEFATGEEPGVVSNATTTMAETPSISTSEKTLVAPMNGDVSALISSDSSDDAGRCLSDSGHSVVSDGSASTCTTTSLASSSNASVSSTMRSSSTTGGSNIASRPAALAASTTPLLNETNTDDCGDKSPCEPIPSFNKSTTRRDTREGRRLARGRRKPRPAMLNVEEIDRTYDQERERRSPISPISPISPVSPLNALDAGKIIKSEAYVQERREERRKRRERLRRARRRQKKECGSRAVDDRPLSSEN